VSAFCRSQYQVIKDSRETVKIAMVNLGRMLFEIKKRFPHGTGARWAGYIDSIGIHAGTAKHAIEVFKEKQGLAIPTTTKQVELASLPNPVSPPWETTGELEVADVNELDDDDDVPAEDDESGTLPTADQPGLPGPGGLIEFAPVTSALSLGDRIKQHASVATLQKLKTALEQPTTSQLTLAPLFEAAEAAARFVTVCNEGVPASLRDRATQLAADISAFLVDRERLVA
jgi:hypothetical protein